jgi:hypothetical protein
MDHLNLQRDRKALAMKLLWRTPSQRRTRPVPARFG